MKRLFFRSKRRLQRDQSGQAIIFLAIGFFALIAFVGLVTDLSIMFVRYSQLRRTVDAAAIASAAQLREGKDYGEVAIAARQFIQLHGLNPRSVHVETCETDIHKWRTGQRLEDHPELEGIIHEEYNDQGTLETSDDTGYRIEDMPTTELCNWQAPRKKVRVSAQIESPTFFLALFGIETFDLEATSVSETAVLDVVLLLDTSASMASATTYEDYVDNLATGTTMRSGPYGFECNLITDPEYYDLRNKPSADLTEEERAKLIRFNGLVRFSGCCNNPGANAKVAQDSNGDWFIYTDTNGNNEYDAGEENIQNNTFDGNACNPADSGCIQYYVPAPGDPSTVVMKCDTPDADPDCVACNPYDASQPFCLNPIGDRTDLICQPFRQAKDASRNFVEGLDYVRGDRIGFVTFDRQGNIIRPVNKSPDSNEIMISDEIIAVQTLNQKVGVREDDSTRLVGSAFGCENDSRSYADFAIRDDPDNLEEAPDNDAQFGSRFGEEFTEVGPGLGDNPNLLRWWSYESIAPCPDTNVGGGLLAANNALTNAETIRRDAVWVIIMLGDGAATASDNVLVGADTPLSYGFYGMCPWDTFCNPDGSSTEFPSWPDCPAGTTFDVTNRLFCNDGDPETRTMCLEWTPEATLGSRFQEDPALYDQCRNSYDADDYARDMADFAGLVEVRPGVPGNFIAIFTIGFGPVTEGDGAPVGVPLLRYIADAGDNGQIDHDLQSDLQEDGTIDFAHDPRPSDNAYLEKFGDPGPCQDASSNLREWCGQYYYSCDEADTSPACVALRAEGKDLDAVFDAIASRLFTRLSR